MCIHSTSKGMENRTSNDVFSIAAFSKNLMEYINDNKLQSPDIFGYSMGGYVALYTEANHPGTLGKIVTLGTKFNWTPEAAAKEVRMLNPEKIEEKVPKFAQYLSKLHAPNDWKVNMSKTADMMLAMGDNPPLNSELFAKIDNEVFLHVGAQDNMVSQEETERVHNALNNSKFEVIEDCEHPIDRVSPEMIQSRLLTIL